MTRRKHAVHSRRKKCSDRAIARFESEIRTKDKQEDNHKKATSDVYCFFETQLCCTSADSSDENKRNDGNGTMQSQFRLDTFLNENQMEETALKRVPTFDEQDESDYESGNLVSHCDLYVEACDEEIEIVPEVQGSSIRISCTSGKARNVFGSSPSSSNSKKNIINTINDNFLENRWPGAQPKRSFHLRRWKLFSFMKNSTRITRNKEGDNGRKNARVLIK